VLAVPWRQRISPFDGRRQRKINLTTRRDVVSLSIFEIMKHAGMMGKLIMFILLIFSVISWSIVIMKFLMFRKARNASLDFLDAFGGFPKKERHHQELIIQDLSRLNQC